MGKLRTELIPHNFTQLRVRRLAWPMVRIFRGRLPCHLDEFTFAWGMPL